MNNLGIFKVSLLINLLFSSYALVFASSCPEKEPDCISLPEIPSTLISPSDRADYLISHFWDNFESEIVRTESSELWLEQSFVNFLSVLPHASSDSIVSKGFAILLKEVSTFPSETYYLSKLVDLYLLSPDSPMSSENQYLLYLEALKNSPSINFVERARIQDKINMLNKNLPGLLATDFNYETTDGCRHTLFESLPDPGAELLLIFFDPECDSCNETFSYIISDTALQKQIEDQSLKILAVYPGEKRDSWLHKVSLLPPSWVIGINYNEIEDEELYYLHSMPLIYLIDSSGKVLKRNVDIKSIA